MINTIPKTIRNFRQIRVSIMVSYTLYLFYGLDQKIKGAYQSPYPMFKEPEITTDWLLLGAMPSLAETDPSNLSALGL